jgi:hypothetical protein
MFQLIRKSYLFYFLIWMLIIQISNLCIDAPELHPEYHQENLTFNEMESILEVILEVVFCWEDALPENQDNDDGKESKRSGKSKIKIPVPSRFAYFYLNQHQYAGPLYKYNFFYQNHKLLFCPPPERQIA